MRLAYGVFLTTLLLLAMASFGASSSLAADTTLPTVSFSAPAGGATVRSAVTVSGSSADAGGIRSTVVTYRVGLGAEKTVCTRSWLVLTTARTWSCNFYTSLLPNGTYTLTAKARDAAGNLKLATRTVKVDNVAPAVTLTAPTAGTPVRGAVVISGTAVDAGGLKTTVLTFSGPSSGAICTATYTAVPAPTIRPILCTFSTVLRLDGTYTLAVVARDIAGNTSTTTRTIVADNSAPTATFNSFVEAANPQFQNSSGSTMYFNPNGTGSATVNINAIDAGVGVNRVDYPDPDGAGSLWTPAGGTDNTGPSPYSFTYSWTVGATSPGLLSATAYDIAGNATPVNFTLTADSTAPSGGSVSYTDGVTDQSSMSITTTSGTDAGSGVDTTQLNRRSATYSGGICGTYGAWSTVGSTNTGSPYTDTTIADANCYQYRLNATDRVGNMTSYTSASTVKVAFAAADNTPPTGSIGASPVGPVSGTVGLTGTAFDADSGVSSVSVAYTGVASGTVCASAALVGNDWSLCTWNTSSLPDGSYTLTATFTDYATNTGTATRNIVVDNNAPTATFSSFVEATNPQFQHSSGSTLFFNPNMSGSFTVNISAVDAGVGIDRVDFPDPDGAGSLWTPAGGTDTTSPSPYSFTYSWSIGATSPGLLSATAYDNAGNATPVNFTLTADSAVPTGGAVTYANAITSGTSANIAITNGSDAGSGLYSVQLNRRSATYNSGICGTYGAWSNIGSANPGSAYTDTTIADGTCYQYQLAATDLAGNMTSYTSASSVKVDQTNPTGVISGTPSGPISGSASLTGTANDSASGINAVDVTYSGPSTGTVCANATVTGTAWSGCTWDTSALADGSYTLTATFTDNAANTSTATRNILVDNNAPLAFFNSFSEVANPQAQYSSGSTLYFNPSMSGSFNVNITAVDAGVGIDRVDFPDPDGAGSLWTPAGGTNNTGPSPYAFTYSWTVGATNPGPLSATAFDMASNPTSVNFTLTADSDAPVAGSVSYADGITNLSSTDITPTSGVDADSGVDTTQLNRRSAAYSGGVCGTYGAWSNIGSTNPGSPYTDSTLADANCYQYRLTATDRVGNMTTYTSANTVKVDFSAP